MKKFKTFLKIFLINILFFLILIISIEVIFGSWFKDNNWGSTLRSERSKEIPYEVKFNDEIYQFIYKKNSYGFRGPEVAPEKMEVILIGGSTTNERFTPLDYTISGQLNNRLKKDNLDINIFNGGVDGQSTVGHIVNFKKWFSKIPNFKPKVIIYYIGINERFYYEYNPNPQNIVSGEFNTPHDFEKMERANSKEKFKDYIKNNSFFISKLKILKFKYLNKKIRSQDYSNFSLTYNLNSKIEGDFITQDKADFFFNINELKKKDKNNFSKSLSERLKHLTKLTFDIGATPIFINQVMYNGQGIEIMYYTNHIIREFFNSNNDVIFVDLAKKINLDSNDFYDEFHTKPSGSKKIADFIYKELKKHLIEILLK